MQIDETTRDGYPALKLTQDDLSATFVPQLGMIGASLEHGGDELLGQRGGLKKYAETGSTMGIPLLYPWANRLSGLTYEAAGKQVRIDPDDPRIRRDPNGLPIHGLLNANPDWQVEQRDDRLAARLDFQGFDAFPFSHELRIEVEIGSGLTITTTVEANQGSPVPISFGFHPYLALPAATREDLHVELPVEERLNADERGIPTGETEPADEPSGPLGERTYDDGYKGVTGPFVLEGAGRRIELSFERGYDYAQVYAPPGKDLICFEPMTAPTNALVSGQGLRVTETEFSAAFRISVTDV